MVGPLAVTNAGAPSAGRSAVTGKLDSDGFKADTQAARTG